MLLPTQPVTAHVGYTDTAADYTRMVRAEEYLAFEFKSAFEGDDFETVDTWSHADVIDLNKGRDFLHERKTYQIVILHFIWNGRVTFAGHQQRGIYANSRSHTAQAWVHRLVKTRARFIIAFGGSSEVSGGFLGSIPGYTMHTYDGEKVVYVKAANFLTLTQGPGKITS